MLILAGGFVTQAESSRIKVNLIGVLIYLYVVSKINRMNRRRNEGYSICIGALCASCHRAVVSRIFPTSQLLVMLGCTQRSRKSTTAI